MSCMVCETSSGGRAIWMSGRERRVRRDSATRGATGVTARGVRAAGLGAMPPAGREDGGGGGGADMGRAIGTGRTDGGGGGAEVRIGGGGGADERTTCAATTAPADGAGWKGGGGRDGCGCVTGAGALVDGPTSDDRSAAAFASSSARSSACASDADSAARRSHLSASARSPRANMASAVDRAQATSSESSFFAGGIGPGFAPLVCVIRPRSSRTPGRAASGSTADHCAEAPVLPFAAMDITVNGRLHTVPDGLTVRALVTQLGWTEGPVAVEINREIVPRARHAEHPVAPGDVVEIVHFVGGG